MNLVWKLLRQHISIPQFAGFFFANLFGMLIVLLGWQFYKDVAPVFTAEDSFMKSDFLIVNKKIGTANTINGRSNTFTNEEIDDLSQQPFVSSVGKFTNTAYKVDANMSVNGIPTRLCPSFCLASILRCITLALPRAIHCRRLAMDLWA